MTIRPLENPPNPYRATHVEWLEEPPPALPAVYEETARSILSTNDSPDIGFRHSINPYRGCHHGCAYCYARPSHQWLDWGAGTDFERRIVVKVNAPALLRETFEKRSWRGEWLVLSGNTDCYQPLEAHYELTRRILSICLDYRNPVGIITKGALVRRDADLLAALAREADTLVHISIPFADSTMARAIEPWAPSPERRFETLAVLAEAGIPVAVSVSPLIPGLNDTQVPEILERAKAAGAGRAFQTLLRLPGEVAPVFEARLREAYPLRADKVLAGLRAMKAGELDRPGYGTRMRGEGARWEAARALWTLTCRRLGLNTDEGPETRTNTTFRRPGTGKQLSIFGD